jgi:hypothetical protein
VDFTSGVIAYDFKTGTAFPLILKGDAIGACDVFACIAASDDAVDSEGVFLMAMLFKLLELRGRWT